MLSSMELSGIAIIGIGIGVELPLSELELEWNCLYRNWNWNRIAFWIGYRIRNWSGIAFIGIELNCKNGIDPSSGPAAQGRL